MGIVEGQKVEGDGLGCEGSGIIRKAGPDSSLKPGDRVIVFASGSFSTRLVTTSKLCVKMADDLDFTDAASMPCVYGTVIHSLLDMARLKTDQVTLFYSLSCLYAD
jgi:NADPH:quinone reductase-like Zn-dependent oxidoreductase